MKKWVSVIAITFMLLSCLATAQVSATTDNVERLGTPHYSVAIMGATYGEDASGKDYIFAVANGKPAVLNIIEVATGERVHSVPLEGASFAWGVDTDNNGNVYIAGSDKLYRYSIETQELENLGRPLASENYLWRITVDEQGRVFGGTYPNGKVYMYDPETGEFTDYGTIVEGQQYVRSIDTVHGKVYAGIGTGQAHLIEIDIETGEKREIQLPEEYQNEKTVYDLDISRNHLFTRVTNSATLLVYDLKSEQWVDKIPNVKGLDVSKPGPGKTVYFIQNGDLKQYDLKDYSIHETPLKDMWSARDFDWVELEEPGFTGLSLVSIRYDGTYWIYNPKSGQYKYIKGQIKGEPINIQSITLGPDGNIYTSAYMTGGLTRYNPTDHTFKAFSGNGQTEGMISTDNYLYLGVYPGANIFQYDPTKPFEIDPLHQDEGINPNHLFSLKSQGQDRPFAFAKGDGNVFVGTVPDYGKLGGSLSVLNESTLEHETFFDIVENQSIVSLAYKDGLVYGGTSVWGGLGTPPTESDGKLFIWNTESQSKTFETVPVPGDRSVTAVAFDGEGYLWGITINTIFKFDPETKTVVDSKELFPFDWSSIGHSWRSAHMQFDPTDGHFYGRTQQGIFKLNPETWEYEVLEPNAVLFAMDDNGDIYFARGEDLYRYKR